MTIRRLGPGDEGVVEALATRAPQTELLKDDRTFFLVAFDGEQPVGFVLAHELPRRHGDPTQLLVYEVEVDESHHRRGIGKALLGELAAIARARNRRGVGADRRGQRSGDGALSLSTRHPSA